VLCREQCALVRFHLEIFVAFSILIIGGFPTIYVVFGVVIFTSSTICASFGLFVLRYAMPLGLNFFHSPLFLAKEGVVSGLVILG